jgi:NAD(P)-dependent dehydrogenase (short-subunit alcohol dehydrogenase family)
MVEQAVERWGGLDVVVNNAYSGGGHGDAVALSEENWDRGMDVGLKSMFRAAKHAVPHLRKSGGGSIVNISWVHGLLAAPNALLYETLKTAVIGLTRQMAVQYGPDGIRVNAIYPGHIVPERAQAQWDAHTDGLRFFEQQYPLRRTGVPLDRQCDRVLVFERIALNHGPGARGRRLHDPSIAGERWRASCAVRA